MLVILVILIKLFSCVTHWKLSESDQIKHVDESPFTMLRPYDLLTFLEQAKRIERLNEINSILSYNDFKRDEKKGLTFSLSNLIRIQAIFCSYFCFFIDLRFDFSRQLPRELL